MATLVKTQVRRREVPEAPGRDHRRVRLEVGENQVMSVIFDHPEKSVNLFDRQTLLELDDVLFTIMETRPSGVIFFSAKPAVFVAGADLESLASLRGEDLRVMVRIGQRISSRIQSLEMPTVAAIHGACLGGGLELALACDGRIASDSPVTRLGLPETQLGILPAWGGSTRLSRLVGLPKALDWILSGRSLKAKRALEMGLVDRVVAHEQLYEAAMEMITRGTPVRKSHFLVNHALSAFFLRLGVGRKIRRMTRGHYPAQEEALKVVCRGARGSIDDSLDRELAALLKLSETDTAKNLLRLFHLQERAKRFRYAPAVSSDSLPEVSRVAVIGAGVMGAGVAQWVAARQRPVTLCDVSPARMAVGMRSVAKLFDGAVKRRIFTPHEARRRADLVTPATTRVPLKQVDLVIEAAVENLEVKKTIFADLCEHVSDRTILATNTSALPVGELAVAPGVTHPGRVLGLHFFHPVSRMKLVEVVVTDRTEPETVERVLAFVRDMGKIPVVVKDSPGFLVNRILMPYLVESARMVDAGAHPGEIDRAMLDFGMPMGPLRLLDEVGLDVAVSVANTMLGAFGDRFSLPTVVERLHASGHLGRKSGRGFYTYPGGKKQGPPAEGMPQSPPGLSREEIAEKLVFLMVEEARRCLAEGIVASGDEVDLAMILGAGFAPFRGGPLAYARTRLPRRAVFHHHPG